MLLISVDRVAPFMMNSVASVIVIVINTSLIRYGGDWQSELTGSLTGSRFSLL
jgi:hypothetical protein